MGERRVKIIERRLSWKHDFLLQYLFYERRRRWKEIKAILLGEVEREERERKGNDNNDNYSNNNNNNSNNNNNDYNDKYLLFPLVFACLGDNDIKLARVVMNKISSDNDNSKNSNNNEKLTLLYLKSLLFFMEKRFSCALDFSYSCSTFVREREEREGRGGKG